MAATLAVGSFMTFLGLLAMLKILVSFYNVAFVRSFLVVIVMMGVVFLARGIIAPVPRLLGTWQRRFPQLLRQPTRRRGCRDSVLLRREGSARGSAGASTSSRRSDTRETRRRRGRHTGWRADGIGHSAEGDSARGRFSAA